MAHPDTYLNKVVVGGRGGRVQLWNFHSGKLLHEFRGWAGADVLCLEPSPALDVVGLGLSDGCGPMPPTHMNLASGTSCRSAPARMLRSLS